MAKKNKERIILENIELKPQVIGYTYKKKSNVGRVIFMLIIFGLAVFYINDISVFINNLLGKTTSSSITNLTNENNKNPNKGNNEENKLVYNIFSNTLEIEEKEMILKNFVNQNNILSFEVLNKSNNSINYTNNKYFIELYNEEKTLLERHKIDFDLINANETKTFTFNITKDFYYFVLEEKHIEDYPLVNLKTDGNKNAILTCSKKFENIIYTFNNNELTSIKHTISESDTTKDNYYERYSEFQNKATIYNNINGISASFNGSLNGYTFIVAIDLINTDLEKLNEKIYYRYKEIPKVVNFEMQTYGYNCI